MDTTAELSDSTLVVEETPPTPALRRPTTSPPPTPLPNRGSSLKDSMLLVPDNEDGNDDKDDKDELQLEAAREQVDARVMGAGAAAAGAGARATEADEPSLTPQPSSSYASDFDLPKFEQSARAGRSPPPDHEREVSASPPASGTAYREHEHVSSNTTRASPGDVPSSDQDDAFPTPPAGQAAPPSTPPRSSTTTTTHEPSSASTQASQARQQLAQPTSSFRGPPTQLDDSPDPMRLIAVPSSRPSAKMSGRDRSRSRSVSIPPVARTKGKGKSKSVSSHRGGGHSSDGPSSSAPPALEMRSSHVDAPSSSASTVTGPGSTFPVKPVVERQPLATRMPSPEPTIIEESPAEEEEVETSRPAQALATKPEARFYVEVPLQNQKRLSLSRTGANENELATPTSTSSGRKSSSRPSSAPPAGAPPAHISSQISRDDEKMSGDGASPKSASPPRRTFPFAVVVPPARRTSAGNQVLPPPAPKAADDAIAAPSPPRPSHRASSELSSPPSSSSPLALPAPEKRVRSAASSSEHSASEPEAGPSQSPAKKRRPAPPKTSKVEKAAPASNDKDVERSGDDSHPTRVVAGKRPRRAAIKKTTLKESSDSEDSGDGSGNGSSSAEEVQQKKKPKRAPSVRKPVASTSGLKGKKVVEKEVNPSQVKAPKLPPSSMPTSTQATAEGLLSLAKLNPAPKETPEQRSESWVLARMDGVSWTLVEHGTTKFWWPAEIVSKPRSTRPLALTLIADPTDDIVKYFPTRQVLLADPSSSNILSFRSSCKGRPIRFDGANFVESAGGVDSEAPTPEAFEGALGNALLRQNSLDFSDDDSADEAPPPAARKPKASASKAKAKAIDLDVSSDKDKDEDEAPAAVESDDELTKDADENKATKFPFRCIALNSRAWWPALCISSSEAGTLDAKGKPLKSAQYNLRWSDGSLGAVPRKKLALPSEKRFFTVPLGDTTLDVPKDYSNDLVNFVENEAHVWDSIIKNAFGPAKIWNDEFMAGGSRRQLLTKWARFGELEEGHRDAISDALKAWALPSDGNRPVGSPQYEALPDASRSLYIVDVLLSIAVILINVEERSHEDKAKAILLADRKPNAPDPTPDEIMDRAFRMAQQELQEGSLSKWVVSVRMNRKMAEGGKKGKGKG